MRRTPDNPSRRTANRLLALLGLAALLAACAGGPAIRYYSLLFAGEGVPATADSPDADLIYVAPFRIEAPYGQGRLVYRQNPASPEVGFYHYHRWARPLAEQLAELTATTLADDFSELIFTTWRSTDDSLPSIRGRLLELTEVDVEGGVEVRARLELAVFDAAGGRLARETLEGRAAGTPASVDVLVRLMRSALDRSLASSSALRRALRSLTDSP